MKEKSIKDPAKAKEFVEKIFKVIEEAKLPQDLENIMEMFHPNNIISESKYPKITFSIDKKELEELSDFSLKGDNIESLKNNIQNNTLAKLLYALVWKNGDLVKLKHIIKGIKNVDQVEDDKNDGLVFYQFGKYLTNQNNEPIVDQHVLRAFAISDRMRKSDRINSSISEWQKMETINKSNKFLIKDYKEWLKVLPINNGTAENYTNEIDKILFALGKTIKHKPKSNK
jgi:hypothetical protein